MLLVCVIHICINRFYLCFRIYVIIYIFSLTKSDLKISFIMDLYLYAWNLDFIFSVCMCIIVTWFWQYKILE